MDISGPVNGISKKEITFLSNFLLRKCSEMAFRAMCGVMPVGVQFQYTRFM